MCLRPVHYVTVEVWDGTTGTWCEVSDFTYETFEDAMAMAINEGFKRYRIVDQTISEFNCS